MLALNQMLAPIDELTLRGPEFATQTNCGAWYVSRLILILAKSRAKSSER
jgi:hypothetical protein